MVAEADTDGDGEISWSEFQKAMRQGMAGDQPPEDTIDPSYTNEKRFGFGEDGRGQGRGSLVILSDNAAEITDASP